MDFRDIGDLDILSTTGGWRGKNCRDDLEEIYQKIHLLKTNDGFSLNMGDRESGKRLRNTVYRHLERRGLEKEYIVSEKNGIFYCRRTK